MTKAAEAALKIAMIHHQRGHLGEAVPHYRAVLAEMPDLVPVLANLGAVLAGLGRHDEALEVLSRAVRLDPASRVNRYNLGNLLREMARPAEALEAFDAALAIDPGHALSHNNRAVALLDLGREDEALGAFDAALAIDSVLAEAHIGRGGILVRRDRAGEAVEAWRAALAADPDQPALLADLAQLLSCLGRWGEAVVACREALARDPGLTAAVLAMAKALLMLRRPDAAVIAYRRAAEIDPASVDARYGVGYSLALVGDLKAAIAAFEQVEELRPGAGAANIVYCRQVICDWDGLDEAIARLRRFCGQGQVPPDPFSLLSWSKSAEEQYRAGRHWSQAFGTPAPLHRGHDGGGRLRIGYLLADLNVHAVTVLMGEMLERHDRDRFDIHIYHYGERSEDPFSRRLAACGTLTDLRPISHVAAATRIVADRIDILVDLAGYTRFSQPQIAAFRPAPVQVSYLGFPGTMGAPFIDYIIADPYLVPFDRQPFYAEKIVHLPHCYQPSDTRRSDAPTTRAEAGLPEDAVVLAALHNTNKIAPDLFAVWMRLLAAHPRAVLWLYGGNEAARANLRREAERAGVDPARLIFTAGVGYDLYLGRLALADLFLDSHPYNAGATANDALWMGLPLLTCSGETYVSRMAGSLLSTLGLPDLIATDLADYEARAMALLADPARLADLRGRLAVAKETSPLFDIEAYTRHLEAAYLRMAEISRAGLPPQSFSVAP